MYSTLFRIGCLALLSVVLACDGRQTTPASPATGAPAGEPVPLKKVKLVIDWQPSGEYYGFFYAKSQGSFSTAGYDVDIVYGKGAPSVAAEVGTGAVMIGTTTSDNLVRWVAKDGKFSFARPLIAFNPSVVVSLASSNITKIDDLKGKTIGVNPESSVYSQLLSAIRRPSLEAIGAKEDPTIGWSGMPQLRGKRVDAILGYTTNVALDLTLAGESVNEIFLGDHGIRSYGLILVATGKEHLARGGLNEVDVAKIADVVAKAYVEGAEPANVDLTVAALRKVDPQLDAKKVSAAIERIRSLNSRMHYPLGAVDEWVESQQVPRAAREKALALYR